MRKYQRKGLNKTCEQCGGSFYVPKGRAHAKFCSTACHRTARCGSADPVEAFWSKVDKSSGESGCWLYMGFRKWDGYGWLARAVSPGKYRHMTAHRYAWILTHGEPAKGMHILHKCDNPPCCNPDHLRLGTHAENMADCKAKGRVNSGYRKHGKRVLWPDRVRPVRRPA